MKVTASRIFICFFFGFVSTILYAGRPFSQNLDPLTAELIFSFLLSGTGTLFGYLIHGQEENRSWAHPVARMLVGVISCTIGSIVVILICYLTFIL